MVCLHSCVCLSVCVLVPGYFCFRAMSFDMFEDSVCVCARVHVCVYVV